MLRWRRQMSRYGDAGQNDQDQAAGKEKFDKLLHGMPPIRRACRRRYR
jgi:hypothetical protein